ncbi:MAG: bifunctional phosphopantothenoylcysteine decarboxylase/phosphopantothenate--cysteine ligase CoaBC [Bacteroidota bacterium]
MSVWSGRKVLLGVTAGIAAYKSALLVRLFVKSGAEVRVVMTPAAKEFVTPLTLSTLSKNEVYSSFTNEEDENARWNNHVELGLWADLFVIAPATANTLSKMSTGTSDNLLVATYLSAKCPVYLAPAMDLDMYQHPSTKETLQKLEDFGNVVIPAAHGELASGLVGQGRMAEPEAIVEFIENDILQQLPLRGKQFLITAGPTYEAIDPVRFIGNHSSGKMGYAIAEVAASMGASVILISGPTGLVLDDPRVAVIRVTSAQEMYDVAFQHFKQSQVAILSAAVADYRPAEVADQKLKKKEDELTIQLEKTKDILASLGAEKNDQYLVGFALETQNELENAKTKLEKKNLDLIILNSLNDEGAGFGVDTNKVTFVTANNKVIPFEVKTKKEVANDIIQYIINELNA